MRHEDVGQRGRPQQQPEGDGDEEGAERELEAGQEPAGGRAVRRGRVVVWAGWTSFVLFLLGW